MFFFGIVRLADLCCFQCLHRLRGLLHCFRLVDLCGLHCLHRLLGRLPRLVRGCLRLPRPVRVFFALACVWTAFIAFLAFMAFKDQLSLSKVMTLEQGQLQSLLSEEQ